MNASTLIKGLGTAVKVATPLVALALLAATALEAKNRIQAALKPKE